MATNSAPVSSETPLSQLVTGSPSALPTGTRPEAIGADHRPHEERGQQRRDPEDGLGQPPVAGPVGDLVEGEPRAAQHDAERGEAERDEQRRHRAAKAAENAVQSTTRTKISQTWFASQTGPIAQSISARGPLAALAPAESSDQNPAPKSAPPNTA